MLMLATLNTTPPPILPSDVVTTTGGILRIRRNGAILFTVDLRPVSVPFTGVVLASQIQPNQIYWERTMAGINTVCTSVSRNASTGVETYRFANGNEREITPAQREQIADAIDSNVEYLENLIIGRTHRASPDGSNLETQIGVQYSANLAANQPIVVGGE